MLVIEPNRLFAEPTAQDLTNFILDIYDEYLGGDDLGTLQFYKNKISNGEDCGELMQGFEYGGSVYYDNHPGRRDTVIEAIESMMKKVEGREE